MAMLPPLFLTSMPIDNRLPLSVGAPMVRALPRGIAAMFTRSTLGRPQPRIGGLSVAKTQLIRKASRSEAAKRAWKTKRARKCSAGAQ